MVVSVLVNLFSSLRKQGDHSHSSVVAHIQALFIEWWQRLIEQAPSNLTILGAFSRLNFRGRRFRALATSVRSASDDLQCMLQSKVLACTLIMTQPCDIFSPMPLMLCEKIACISVCCGEHVGDLACGKSGSTCHSDDFAAADSGLACIVQAGSGLLLHDRKTKCLYTFCANAFHCIAAVAQVICETSSQLDFHAVIC